MAWIEKRGSRYHINFFHGGRHFSRTLKTGNAKKAEAGKARLEENLADLERGRLELPPGADLLTFLLSDGKLQQKVRIEKELTLGDFFKQYRGDLPEGAKESSTRYTEEIHIAHLLRLIGTATAVRAITTDALQEYVKARSKETGWHGEPLSHVTIQKEIGTLASVWNKWAVPRRLVTGPAPTRNLDFAKAKAKPPFQTRAQIERQIGRGGLAESQERELWDALFLTLPEIQEVLDVVRGSRFRFVYPMFVFAARTGARRSEILRSRIDDFDFVGKMVRIREKKRDRTREFTFRHVPLSPLLAQVMKDWFLEHPGGQLTICQEPNVPVTVQMSNHHFGWALEGSRWAGKLKGWHVFRHSFASNCAAKGVDQRLIDEWMGHQTEDMRRRYRHLFPSEQQQALQLVFADDQVQPAAGCA